MRNEIEEYINENIHLIRKIEFYNSFVLISMFDGTTIDMCVDEAGNIDYNILKE